MEELLAEQEKLSRRIANMVDNFKKCGKDKMTEGALEARIKGLENYKARFDSNHATLVSTYKDMLKEQPYWKSNLQERTEDNYLVQMSMLLDYRIASQARATTTEAASTHVKSSVRPLDLPTFDGKYEEWPSFKDLFLSIIDSAGGLSKVEKLQHLKVSLRGDAFTLVRDLPTTACNYTRAWTLLTDHYENQRILVGLALSKLTTFTKMKSESASELESILLKITSMVHQLEGIGRPVGSHEDLLVFLVVELLDHRTRSEWEMSTNSTSEPPSFEILRSFLDRRIQALNKIQGPKIEPPKSKRNSPFPSRSHSRNFHTSKVHSHSAKCPICNGDHIIMFCDSYKSKTGSVRKKLIEAHNHCLNCLGKHILQECKSPKTCQTCKERHHTSIHDAFLASASASPSPNCVASQTIHLCSFAASPVLLATARIRVADTFGNFHSARALIDQGAETSMLTERLAQRLQLKRARTSIALFGVGGVQTGVARRRVSLTLRAHTGAREFSTRALIMPRLSIYSSKLSNRSEQWNHLQGLTLADPTFYNNDQIDIILGADVHALIILPGLRKGQPNEPIAQNTSLGWILSGKVNSEEPTSDTSAYQCVLGDPLSALVRSFWEQEEIPKLSTSLTPDEIKCEEHFATTHSRTAEGRYMVRLPLKQTNFDVTATRKSAERAILYNERKFKRKPELHQLYAEFMNQYDCLKHMTKVENHDFNSPVAFLPHHGVLRESSTTTKLRVVFNGSAKVPSGKSLNDYLMTGPNLLPSLADVLLKWRMHAFVLVTDVEKMYRQILVDPRDRDYQRILWRVTDQEDISEYQLNTVTYGLACAPYLAIRTMHQLASDDQTKFPLGASALRHDMYVDDILTGARSETELVELKNQLVNLCKGGGLPLQKWATNSSLLRHQLSTAQQVCKETISLKDTNDQHLTLGLVWHPSQDFFSFSVKPIISGPCTRRSILSHAAQLFDPLGWLTPVTVKAKIIIQGTWLLKLDWDAPLPQSIVSNWTNFREQWNALTLVKLPRPVTLGSREGLELVGYCDASEQAYAAVVYLKQTAKNQPPKMSLLSAKSKVAPLKQVSLPRLELCSARLLAQLTKHIAETLQLKHVPIQLWSDSTVALGWIRRHPSKWKTYVANRVSEIQLLLPEATWHHIPGNQNPADCASRGLSPEDLVNHPLWWHGPKLTEVLTHDPTLELEDQHLPDQRSKTVLTTTLTAKEENWILARFSDYQRLLRVTAYCRRWIQRPVDPKKITASRNHLTAAEVEAAELRWIRLTQACFFSEELSALTKSESLPRRSHLRTLTPFMDDLKILRVGGRLRNASLPTDKKHLIILPTQSRFTTLLVEATHKRTLHGGIQLTMNSLRQRYWIPKLRALVKSVVHRCIPCIRWRAATPKFLMGSLPAPRVNAARPFLHTGVDYAGPIFLRTSPGRGHKSYKGFLVIFVCLCSRAIHLDVVSSYTSEAFLAALKRFISRRGFCSHLYSDQGSNFVGAEAEIKRLLSTASREGLEIANALANLKINWHFNPPGAPHFGGIWEAAVKSTKFHLRRVIGDHLLTYEEMATLLSQVEACLNSRPLCALTDDVDDLTALTPGHFLIGTALNQLPEPSLLAEKTSLLTRWQLLTQMRDHFWKRWCAEYLHTLLPRHKWQQPGPSVAPGTLCLVLHDSTPPTRWPLGRILEAHPGSDGHVRVVTVKTNTSTYKRPVTKLV